MIHGFHADKPRCRDSVVGFSYNGNRCLTRVKPGLPGAGYQCGRLQRILFPWASHDQGAIQNPLFLPPVDREFLWNQTVDSVDDYFRIEREERPCV